MSTNHYKAKCRFKSMRSIKEEIDYRLEIHEKKLTTNMYKAILSYMTRIEGMKLTKKKALKQASERYGVTQSGLSKTVKELDIQIYHARDLDYKKEWGKANSFVIYS